MKNNSLNQAAILRMEELIRRIHAGEIEVISIQTGMHPIAGNLLNIQVTEGPGN